MNLFKRFANTFDKHGVPIENDGNGDMKKSAYDADGSVAEAGGIAPYVEAHGSGLPDPSSYDDGTVLIKVGNEWKAQSGYGYEEEELIPVVDESVTVIDDDGDIYGAFTDTFNLIVGNEYIVNFNGTEYTTLCEYNQSMCPTIGGHSTNTGIDFSEYPFAIIDYDDEVMLCPETVGLYSIKISTTASSVTTIDQKFIPGGGDEFVVKFSIDDNMNVTSDKTWDEILAAVTSGKILRAYAFDVGICIGEVKFDGSGFFHSSINFASNVATYLIFNYTASTWTLETISYTLTPASEEQQPVG